MGGAILLLNIAIHFIINFDDDRFITVHTHRIYRDGKRFFLQAPLHEGRCNRIDRSGGVNVFAGAECQLVRCFVSCHRIRPENLTFVIANQKKKIFL